MISLCLSHRPYIRYSRVPLASTILIYALFTIPRAHGAVVCAPRTEDFEKSQIVNSNIGVNIVQNDRMMHEKRDPGWMVRDNPCQRPASMI